MWAAALVMLAQAVQAQVPRASVFLPRDHWAVEALRRLHTLGLGPPGYDPSLRSPTRAEVWQALERADSLAGASGVRTLVDGWTARWQEEFGSSAEGWDASVDGGYRFRSGALAPGTGYDTTWTGPTAVPDTSTLAAAVRAAAVAGRFAGRIEGRARAGGLELGDSYALGVAGAFGAWLGRRGVGYGAGRNGSLVLTGRVPMDGGGVYLARPVLLPWLFRYVGPIRGETFLARLDRNGDFEHPLFWGSRLYVRPHPRLGLGVTRGVTFGGEGNAPLTFANIVNLIIGQYAAGSIFEDNVVSLDMDFRIPAGGLPLLFYTEWAFNDAAGAIYNNEAHLVGLDLAAVPGVPQLSLSAEYTTIPPVCCNHAIWYRHWWFDDGWSVDGVPLGHGLGGHGSELSLVARADLAASRLRLDARFSVRDRGAENIYAPDREGRSTGGRVRVAWRALPALDLMLGARLEAGAGWTDTGAAASLRFFGGAP